ncbi:MAG: hypothetical protein QOE52_974 [Mycobacterium sp.]|nr:hypothetical protein [Mycobacterium sp.]MDT5308736.1 hypothetical protein [Mycobacterium sp.]MDT5341790.1 hypothetical protein [Mycobacterium sp.]
MARVSQYHADAFVVLSHSRAVPSSLLRAGALQLQLPKT